MLKQINAANIVENAILINKFIGLNLYVPKGVADEHAQGHDRGYSNLYIINEGKHNWYTRYAQDFTYHSSWDAIMSAVEKIESIELGEYKGFNVSIGSCEVRIKQAFQPNKLITFIPFSENAHKLTAVYVAVLEFIEWYNSIVTENSDTAEVVEVKQPKFTVREVMRTGGVAVYALYNNDMQLYQYIPEWNSVEAPDYSTALAEAAKRNK